MAIEDGSRAAVGRDTSRAAARRDLPADATGVHLVGATRAAAGHDACAGSTRRLDSLVSPRGGHRTTDPARVIGTKPPQFARWVLDLLGAAPGDRLDDLYPGSGGIGRAWAIYTGQEG